MDGREFAEFPFRAASFGFGNGVAVGAVEEGVSVSLIMLEEDGFLECRNLSLSDFFGGFAGDFGDGI